MIRNMILTGMAAASLSGCISLLPSSEDLEARLALDPGEPKVSANLVGTLDKHFVVEDPQTARVLNTFSVAVATGAHQFEYLNGAEWTDRVPVLVGRYLRQKFENEGLFKAVGDRTEFPVGGDYQLHTDIRAFHIDRSSGNNVARVTLRARLSDGKGNTIGTRLFSASAQPDGRDLADTARALNSSASIVSDDMIAWVKDLVK